MLEVRLLGAFEVRSGGTPVAMSSLRAQSLLAYLALRGGAPQRREQVAYLLWPDSAEQQARTNLRHVLHTLRASVPDPDRHVRTTARTLSLHEFSADLTAFDAALARSGGDGADEVAPLRLAADLYGGDLLDGWYDEWLIGEREQYRQRVLAALARLVPLLEARGELDAATGYAERARELDRLAEAPYRWLMRLYDARGDRARAVNVYHECVARLEDELGVSPSAKTLASYEALLPEGDTRPRTSGAATFVGRQPQRRLLTELWRDAGAGVPHLVVVTGEAGIGKTRLLEEFRHWAGQRGAPTASARSYEAEGALAYAPVVAWLRELGVARWRGRLTPAQLAALTALLPELSAQQAPAQQAPAEPGSRLRLFEAAAAALRAGVGPVLLVADDLHAADAPTLQFLHYLMRADPPAPLLVAATARLVETEAGHPLRGLLTGLTALERCTELALGRLDRVETAMLAHRLGHDLGHADADRLHAETEGSPLFVVEALRAGWHAGEPRVLTPKVQAVLEARLLPLTDGARELIGVAAAAGSSVSVDVLARIHPRGEHEVARDLDELWRRQLLLTSGGDRYDFSHGKLREVAYRLMSPARRRRAHALLARALQDVHADRLDAVAGQIAVHLYQAGSREEAVDWYQRAAQAAQLLYADADAADLLRRAWEILRSAPESRGRDERELALLTALPGPLSAARGYASAHLRTALDRAFVLAARLGVEPGAPLLRARAMAVLSRGEFDAALEYGGQLRALGEDDDVLAVEGDFVRGVAAAWRNEAALARDHLRAAVARYRTRNRSAHLLAYGQDPQVLCLVRLAHVHFCLGDAAEARRLRHRSIELARAVNHPFTLAGALLFAALLDLDLADVAALRERVDELTAMRPRVEAPPIRLVTDAMGGYLAVLDGAAGPGLKAIDGALADPARDTAPGVPAMLLRIRLAATRAAGLDAECRETARRLLADGVRVWDAMARAELETRQPAELEVRQPDAKR
ncbi:AAA family ATPase [Frankia sp. CNm7]|uniref:AAA family ATPase n=1 Tax=Frankia nepalensis TaxID=1836974 RepID=A0A937RF99_9ACTN|nr:AAA family ATPase [Frankia nepalensis]MBL7497624.1 AAA family ATPase [Frankia nepalensis]MBL7510062.1 AAA family ATPase [Frankia nepalensis]MBL7519062.1 AAA family ATPase [Frankia nepalensis]MBL7631083.1 AAA family ATPase [Frankia nepalensis]